MFGLDEKYLRRLSDEVGDLTLEQSIRVARQLEASGYQNHFVESAKLSRKRSSRSREIGLRGDHISSDKAKCDYINAADAVSLF